MKNTITYKGNITFDIIDKTQKHKNQSSWKKVAMIMMDGEICEYYRWFIEKRYGIVLNKPLRNAHISFINDSVKDIAKGIGLINDKLVCYAWDKLVDKYEGKEIDVVLDLDVRSDKTHWWLNITNSERELLHSIRNEIGLGRPYFGLHMSIGYANEKNIEQSNYIVDLCTKYGKEYL